MDEQQKKLERERYQFYPNLNWPNQAQPRNNLTHPIQSAYPNNIILETKRTEQRLQRIVATSPVEVANRCSPYLNLKSQSEAVVGSSIHQGKYTTSPNTFNSASKKLRFLDYFPPIFSWQKCSRSKKNFKIFPISKFREIIVHVISFSPLAVSSWNMIQPTHS